MDGWRTAVIHSPLIGHVDPYDVATDFKTLKEVASTFLEHPHPLKTELKSGCRIVQFRAELPHHPAKRMPWTILHPLFAACPAKRLCFAGRWVGLNWTQWRMRQGSVPFRRKLRGFGFAPQGKWVAVFCSSPLLERCLSAPKACFKESTMSTSLLQGWSPPAVCSSINPKP